MQQLNNDLDSYRIEKENRRRRRNHYIQQLAIIRQKIRILGTQKVNTQSTHNKNQHKLQNVESVIIISNPEPSNAQLNSLNAEDEALLHKQNSYLKDQLARLQTQQHQKLSAFKTQIQSVKNLYIAKIKQISEYGRKQKQQYTSKMKKITEQVQNATKKNAQFELLNAGLEQEIKNTQQVGFQYANEIQKQYEHKLKEFEQIFNSSTEKIAELERKSDSEDIVQSTLNNPEIIQDIKQNAEKAAEDIDRIFADYKELLAAKTQILQQMAETSAMKQKQVQNCKALETKLKNILQKLSQEKEIYLAENQKINDQLLEIKSLMQKVVGTA